MQCPPRGVIPLNRKRHVIGGSTEAGRHEVSLDLVIETDERRGDGSVRRLVPSRLLSADLRQWRPPERMVP
jgi:hypothetical protein